MALSPADGVHVNVVLVPDAVKDVPGQADVGVTVSVGSGAFTVWVALLLQPRL